MVFERSSSVHGVFGLQRRNSATEDAATHTMRHIGSMLIDERIRQISPKPMIVNIADDKDGRTETDGRDLLSVLSEAHVAFIHISPHPCAQFGPAWLLTAHNNYPRTKFYARYRHSSLQVRLSLICDYMCLTHRSYNRPRDNISSTDMDSLRPFTRTTRTD